MPNQKTLFINTLIPIVELKHLDNYLNKFDYEKSSKYVQESGLDIADFYFKREPNAWFCYYAGFVLVDIPEFTRPTLEALHIIELIDLQRRRLRESLENHDFRSFFYVIDKRLAIQAFFELFKLIPDKDKYDIFWFMYSNYNLKINDFSPSFINAIISYQELPLNIETDVHKGGPENNGLVTVYRGHGYKPTPVYNEHSWTLDINTAIRFATTMGMEGTVYQAKVFQNDILAYIKRKNEEEIVVFPANLMEIHRVELLSLSVLWPHLLKNGVIAKYHHYAQMLKPDYFYRPWGIHGVFHTRRVLFLALCLAYCLGLDEPSTNSICIAAVFHDIGRINDNLDPRHGLASYQKAFEADLIRCENLEEREIVRFLIENHCISDQQAQQNIRYYDICRRKQALYLYTIFKDADGLDRIRINDLNINHLRTEPARNLLLVARQLFIDFKHWIK